MKIQPVVLCGGSGTRLWPLSREQYPKQLLALNGEHTLLQATVQRLDGIGADLAQVAPVIVCNEEHRFLVAEQLRSVGIGAASIILEPSARGTAPALTLAALKTVTEDDPVLLVMPSDHLIADLAAFRAAVECGAGLAADGCLVTFGVPPAAPETGYGYIRTGTELNAGRLPLAYFVESFVEKPEAAAARHYVASGCYLWNSGIFAMRASVWIDSIGRFQPEMLSACQRAYCEGGYDGDFYRVDGRAFAECPEDSIDYSVMERLERDPAAAVAQSAVVRLDAGWSDVGAWNAIWETGDKDGEGNVIHGDVLAVDTRDALLIARHRLLGCVGLENVVVIETADAVLVADRARAQDVKQLVSCLKGAGRQEYLVHRKTYRPWGSYDSIDRGERFQVKRIVVNPGGSLSLQMHHHRAEHWVVVRGTARVTRGDEVFLLTENQSTYIPLGVRHRLENPGTLPLEIVEVQSGPYLGEDDIVRFADTYGRGSESLHGEKSPDAGPGVRTGRAKGAGRGRGKAAGKVSA